ncbi:P-loop NTPase family protein [Galbibacter mesophilus]|uniref:hypothetical protein n=1 Tax=Galbibacter mesophilus TaxID=379069 RepID=UPI00192021B9|nr:hypothetical protein [Galbibacter mesophilus]MCM5664277.1 hypothetical protein [Galbibacter mesophilus]
MRRGLVHVKKVLELQKERKKIAPKKERNNKIMTHNLKRIFNQEAISFFELENRSFVVDADNKNFYNLFCKYWARDVSFENDHNGELEKGLFVYGKPGSGKTTSFKIIQNVSVKYGIKKLWAPLISAEEVVSKYNLDRYKDYIIGNYSKGNFIFDDLGSEKEANNTYIFGKEDIFQTILERRYNAFIENNTKTYITSNLSINEIQKRYGERVSDRIIRMCNILQLDGDSRRL